MGSLGLRRSLDSAGPFGLSLLGDLGAVTLAVAEGEGALAGLGASVSRARLGIEGSLALGGVTGAMRISGRADGGDGITGGGVELASELRYGTGRLEGAISGRWLLSHSAAGHRESAVSARLDWRAREDRTGLAFSLSPSWGGAGLGGMGGMSGIAGMGATGSTAMAATANPSGLAASLWSDERMRSLTGAGSANGINGAMATGNTLSLETQLGYGITWADGRHLRPWAAWRDLGGASRELGLGFDLEGPWTMQMKMTRRASALESARWQIQFGLIKPLGSTPKNWRQAQDHAPRSETTTQERSHQEAFIPSVEN